MLNYTFQLTPAYCLFNRTAVLYQKGSKIRFLMENDNNYEVRSRLEKAFGNYVDYVRSQNDCPESYESEIDISFEKGNISSLRKCISSLYEQKNVKTDEETIENEKNGEAAAVLLLDNILEEARKTGASDIHIEKYSIWFRINGHLEKQMELQKERFVELVLRIKLLSGMNVMESRKSQDGHFVFDKRNPVFVRTSSMGVIGTDFESGEESIVLRLLDSTRTPLDLLKLGFTELQNKKISELLTNKNGLILVSGPTGAGKSTTSAALMTLLQKNNENGLKIISLEDPPEFYIPEITQVQILEKTGITYENALKHIFRQDPDVIMIGEIRDEKSAETAVRASLTGHLVIATVHTMSSGAGILRLEELGIKRTLLLSVLRGIICQDLQHINRKNYLAADVSMVKKVLPENSIEMTLSDELDSLFNHFTNYKVLLARTVEDMILNQEKTVSGSTVNGRTGIFPVFGSGKINTDNKAGNL